jgi:hypothetical protein
VNKNQKILTIVALAVFGAIIGLHYVAFEPYLKFRPPSYQREYPMGRGFSYHFETRTVFNDNVINDVRIPVFVLAVFYAGLFFVLGKGK